MTEKAQKKSVYIESSVISYLTAKENRDLIIAARQKITKSWWKGNSVLTTR
jgi:hypothetical protein